MPATLVTKKSQISKFSLIFLTKKLTMIGQKFRILFFVKTLWWTIENSWNCSRLINFTWRCFRLRFDYATVHNQIRSCFGRNDQFFLNGFGCHHLPFRNIQSGHRWRTCKFWPKNRKFINCKVISWPKPKIGLYRTLCPVWMSGEYII